MTMKKKEMAKKTTRVYIWKLICKVMWFGNMVVLIFEVDVFLIEIVVAIYKMIVAISKLIITICKVVVVIFKAVR